VVAIEQGLDLVAFNDLRSEQGAEWAPQLAIVAFVQGWQLLLDLLFGAGSVLHQQHGGQRGHGRHHDQRETGLSQ
jgi:hypothetical protein